MLSHGCGATRPSETARDSQHREMARECRAHGAVFAEASVMPGSRQT